MAFRIGKAVSMISGGASGLGRATAEYFVKNGGRVAIVDLPNSKGAEVAETLGEKCIFCPTDICNTEDVVNAIESTKDKFGALHVLVNCAGIGHVEKVYSFNKNLPHSLENFQNVIQVNVVGTFNLIRNVVGCMVKNEVGDENQRGVIVNTASIAAYDGQAGQIAYSASKGAIIGMTLPLSRDVARMGIRTVTIAPGTFKTPLLESLPEKVINTLEAGIPFPSRLGKPEEYAKLVESIVENPMLNGEVIRLDGALRMM
ncbi:3-hydroxyacyl-CoA dehydrogenase type-2-like [Styela clava]|uniref:3-hydroxyacyl-CoA dehydrogenase type-2-like n=1 Tax=Styela clava TaxID=7725 RepID=UPI00193A1EE6|nr:3-hydroxyacyl-CoA dehydrogenase type-2-like [Styela clava]